MLKSIRIQGFKRFRDLGIPGFKRVNLIAGRNNTGKTALLEAILLLLDGERKFVNLPRLFRNADDIGDQNENFWRWLFQERAHTRPLFIEGEVGDYPSFGVALAANENGNRREITAYHQVTETSGYTFHLKEQRGAQAVFPHPRSHHPVSVLSVRPSDPQVEAANYDRVVLKRGAEARLEKLLRKIEPRLQALRSIKPYGASLIYADIGLDEKIPAVHLGQGFNRLLAIYSEILASGNNVLLVDEIENGLHHEILPDVWRGIRELAEAEGVQVFATTHSWECVAAAHEVFAETIDYDFALHRLVEVDGDVAVQTLDREGLEASIKGLLDVR
jgi:ABC-type transport system involved in cytochrome c biogenesis ATPase subunit